MFDLYNYNFTICDMSRLYYSFLTKKSMKILGNIGLNIPNINLEN